MYIIKVFCLKAGPSLQMQEPRLQFSRKQIFHRKTQKPRLQFYQGLNRCASFPLLDAPHSLFSTWTDIKRSEKIPGATTWMWWEGIRLTGPSGLHRNSPHGLNINSIWVFDQIRDPEIPITLRPHNTLSVKTDWNQIRLPPTLTAHGSMSVRLNRDFFPTCTLSC